jgi:hypothetical protein
LINLRKRKNKFYFLSAFVLFTLLFTGCVDNSLSEKFSTDTITKEALNTVLLINQYDYEAVVNLVRDDLKAQITPQVLKDAWNNSLIKLGNYKKISSTIVQGTKDKTTSEEYAVAIVNVEYENGKAIFTLSYDVDMNLVGLYMK